MKSLEIGGIYEHYKGTRVRVLFEALHSENQEHLVIYMYLKDGGIWARPKHMFLENIILDGKEVERFKKVEQENLVKSNAKHS